MSWVTLWGAIQSYISLWSAHWQRANYDREGELYHERTSAEYRGFIYAASAASAVGLFFAANVFGLLLGLSDGI